MSFSAPILQARLPLIDAFYDNHWASPLRVADVCDALYCRLIPTPYAVPEQVADLIGQYRRVSEEEDITSLRTFGEAISLQIFTQQDRWRRIVSEAEPFGRTGLFRGLPALRSGDRGLETRRLEEETYRKAMEAFQIPSWIRDSISSNVLNLHSLIPFSLRALQEKARRSALSAEDQTSLKALIRYREECGNYVDSYETHLMLHDFCALERISEPLLSYSPQYLRIKALLALEQYEQACVESEPLLEPMSICSDAEIMYFMNSQIRGKTNLPSGKSFEAFCQNRCPDLSGPEFSLGQTARFLTPLTESYDIAIAIAKGGLWSGFVADLLGMDVRVIEIHAHKRDQASHRMIDSIDPKDIKGKRVLLLDKDTVTGATIEAAVSILDLEEAAQIGVFFNLSPKRSKRDIGSFSKGLQRVKRLGVTIHHPENTEPRPLAPIFKTLQERMETSVGRLWRAERQLNEVLASAGSEHAQDAQNIRRCMQELKDLFFAFNQFLPGAEEARRITAMMMESLVRNYRDFLPLQDILGEKPISRLASVALCQSFEIRKPAEKFAEAFARARYDQKGVECAQNRGVRNEHRPHSYTAAWAAAQKARDDRYDVALIVGPEGFAYEPLFQDLGIPTVAINIPEADYDGSRTLSVFDDLGGLQGKRVLVVEDDVRSGATLRKVLEALSPHSPSHLGLYLGLPGFRQQKDNIPDIFGSTYIADSDLASDSQAFWDHLLQSEVVFKRTYP